MITFNTIDTNKRTPTSHFEFDGSRALVAQPGRPRALLLGIKLSTGNTAELIPKQVFGELDGDAYWGPGSQIAEEARAFKKLFPSGELWGIGIDELSSGTAGTTTITFGGEATRDGTISIMVDGRLVQCGVAVGDDGEDAATAFLAALQGHSQYGRMQYTAARSGAVVTLTRRWKGLDGALPILNYNPTEALPAGVTCAIAAGTAGAGNPDMAELITAMGDVQFDVIVNPFNDSTSLGLLEAELVSRFGGERQIDGLAFSAGFGSLGTLTTLGNSRNSAHLSIMDAGASPTAHWIWAAEYAALAAKHYSTPSAGMTGRAYRMNVLPPVTASRRKADERNGLLFDGISTHVVDAGGNVYVERAITTYQVNSSSIADATYLKVETLQQLSNIRKSRRNHVQIKFEGYMLAASSAELPPNLKVMTPELLRGDAVAQFRDWRSRGWVQGTVAQFEDGYSNEIDAVNETRMREQLAPHLMSQFFGVSGVISFVLQQLTEEAA